MPDALSADPADLRAEASGLPVGWGDISWRSQERVLKVRGRRVCLLACGLLLVVCCLLSAVCCLVASGVIERLRDRDGATEQGNGLSPGDQRLSGGQTGEVFPLCNSGAFDGRIPGAVDPAEEPPSPWVGVLGPRHCHGAIPDKHGGQMDQRVSLES